MRRKDALDVFVLLARRPHTQCIHRASILAIRATRLASTASPQKSTSKPLLPTSSATQVPLHVGLDRNPDAVSAISRIPIPKGEKNEQFTPSTLTRPLGVRTPPLPGQNTPFDRRSLFERKTDYQDRDKAIARRRVYLRSYLRPYYQEWSRLRYHSGKTFVSSDRLFKRDKALYFPNIWGQTLSEEGDGPDGGRDTTPVLNGKVSIVAMQSGRWAQQQVASFLNEKSNPVLEQVFVENADRIQRVDVNMQGDLARAWLVKLLKFSLKRQVPKERWSRYFLVKLPRDVRKGLDEETRDAMGLLNSNVGYVYLVDSDCKIRWAGSGDAWEGEVAGLNGAVQRLLQEEKSLKGGIATARPAVPKPRLDAPRQTIPEPAPTAAAMAAT